MPNFINTPSTPHQDVNFIDNDNISHADLSSWITYLLIQELNENNPVTTELITNFLNNNNTPNDTPNNTPNNTPNDTPNDTPNTFSTILNHDDQDLYDTDYSSDDDYNSPNGYNSPTSIIDFPNHITP